MLIKGKPFVNCYLWAAVILAVSNAWFIRSNRRLEEAVLFYRSLQHPTVGAHVPALRGKGPNGNDVIVSYDREPKETLIFAFSPLCGYCKLSWPAWTALAQGASEKRIVFANIRGTITQDFLRRYPVGTHTLISALDESSIDAYSLHETPTTVLVSSVGEVEKVWTGALTNPKIFAEVKHAVGWRND